MELDLVTALTAANITVLQPSQIQQQDKPVDVPYLFVRLINIVYVQATTISMLVSSFHNMWLYSILHHLHFFYHSIIAGKVRKDHFLEHV